MNPDFMNSFISGYNLQLIMYMAERLVETVFRPQIELLKLNYEPKVGVINVDGREILDTVREAIIMGQYMVCPGRRYQQGHAGQNNE